VGDAFAVWSDLASIKNEGKQYYETYKITKAEANGRYSEADIKATTSDSNGNVNGLWWKNDTDEHSYYAFYPASCFDSSSKTFTAKIPATQNGTKKSESETAVVYQVDTNEVNLFMAAAAKQKHTNNNGKVELDFAPAFTAFEFELKSGSEELDQTEGGITVYDFELSSNNTALTGNFSPKFAFNDSNEATMTYDCPAYTKGSNNSIKATFNGEDGIKVTTTKSLTFTILTLPQDISGLSITFNTSAGEKILKLTQKNSEASEYDYYTFGACKKHKIKGLALPGGWNFSYVTLNLNVLDWVDEDYNVEKNTITVGQFTVKSKLQDSTKFTNTMDGRTYLALKAAAEASDDATSQTYKKAYDEAYSTYKYARQTYLFDGTEEDIRVSFKILAPQNSKWSWTIKPAGDVDSFTDYKVKSNVNDGATYKMEDTETGVTGPLNGKASTSLIIHFKPNSKEADQVIWFNVTLTDPDGNVYNIDFCTQLFDLRGYIYFVLNGSDDKIKELNK